MPRFAIAGAGIAGLATALSLGRDGHEVVVFERRAVPGELGAGLQLSPNATRLLSGWGLLPALEAVAMEPDAVEIRRARDATILARLPLGPAARARYGAPSLVAHRADLHDVLVRAANAIPGVQIRTGLTVAGLEGATVRVSGPPSRIDVDGLVRADGVHAPSLDGTRPLFSGKTAWRGLVPRDGLPVELTRPRTSIWLGPRAHLVHYPLRQGKEINIVLVVDGHADRAAGDIDLWSRRGDPDMLRAHLGGWHPMALRLLDRVAEWRTWPLLHRVTPHPWSRDRQTTVGDAAHPMLPFLAQGASQSIEDAAALARAVAANPTDIATAFMAYERSRAPRALNVQRRSERQGRIYQLSGPAAAGRDLALRLLGPQRLLAGMDWLYGPPQL